MQKWLTPFLNDGTYFLLKATFSNSGIGKMRGTSRLKLAAIVLPATSTIFLARNTSSSSIWYELGFTERSGDLKAGHRILQVAFGSGFKCNSMVWLCLRN
mmetsp:Transcript_28063/g.23188  ORF Transcript_28063/g.23188 Transcript_28063/m.23188 type:complete len:100 (-) Transcript_28063:137-436(-)